MPAPADSSGSSDTAGPRVVLVHGAPDRSRSFAAVRALLDDRLEVVAYDRRGYGEQTDATPATSLMAHADDLLAVLDGRPATLVGHSFGSTVVLAAATRQSDLVRSIGVWEPPLPWVDWWPTPQFIEILQGIAATNDDEVVSEGFASRGLAPGTWERLAPRTRQILQAEGPAYRADMRSILDEPFALADVRTPGIVAVGATTTTGHREAARVLAPLLGTELWEVEGAGHYGPQAHPEQFAAMVHRAVELGWPGWHPRTGAAPPLDG